MTIPKRRDLYEKKSFAERLFLPFFLPPAFPEAIEHFLETMAKKGWFLEHVSYFPPLWRFEKNVAASVRYRLEAAPDTSRMPPRQMTELYAEYGWRYVAPLSHFFYVFAAETADAPEIHSDPLVQSRAYGRMLRSYGLVSLAILVLLGVFLAMPLYRPTFFITYPRLSLFLTGYFLLAAILVLYPFFRLLRRKRMLAKGYSLSHKGSYRSILLAEILLIVLTLAFLTPFLGKLRAMDEKDTLRLSLAEVSAPLPYLPMETLYSTEEWTFPSYNPSDEYSGNYVTSQSAFLAPVYFSIHEEARDAEYTIASYQTTFYGEFPSALLAKAVSLDLISNQKEFPGLSGKFQTMKETYALEGCDEARWQRILGRQILYLRQESRMLVISYEGPADLREHLDGYTALFDETYLPLA
ncbi:DUF2812 domain-containing protein [Anaerotignum lactatifermentans]|nr:DUF2812 domain-containing protein [Anaerotignum lactatifermentans]